MLDPELQRIFDSIPEDVKTAITTHNSVKLAEAATGIHDFTLENVATHFGVKMAQRRNNFRPIAEGLMALQKLRG